MPCAVKLSILAGQVWAQICSSSITSRESIYEHPTSYVKDVFKHIGSAISLSQLQERMEDILGLAVLTH